MTTTPPPQPPAAPCEQDDHERLATILSWSRRLNGTPNEGDYIDADAVLSVGYRRTTAFGTWIPCSERMPEHTGLASKPVLAVDRYGSRNVMWTGPDGHGGREWHPSCHYRPVAWMPLPDPPTTEQKQETTG